MHSLVAINLYFHSNKREWRARYMDNGVKKAKHFSCKRYREDRSFFLASLFMRALSEYHEVPTDDFISYWALRTDTFGAFGNVSQDTPKVQAPVDSPAIASRHKERERSAAKGFGFKTGIAENKAYTGLANALTAYKLVKGDRNNSGTATPCMLRNDSSGDLLSETSREDSEASSDAENDFKDDFNSVQMRDDAKIKHSIFYDGDFSVFLQRQKLLYRVIEDLQSSVFVSKPSVDFVPKIDLESIEREYILLDPKLLGSRGVIHPLSRQTRARPPGDIANNAKRLCAQNLDIHAPRPPDYTLERVLKKCSDCATENILQKSVHLQKLVSLLSGENPAEVYTNEILDGICTVKSMCSKTGSDFGAGSFYAPSLKHPIDSISESYAQSNGTVDKQVVTENTLYSSKNAFMMPKNLMNYITSAKTKEGAMNGSEEEDNAHIRIPRLSNSKLAHFIESLCGVNFDETIIKNSLEQNAKECCDLRSLIQISRGENEGESEEGSTLPVANSEYFTNTANHIGYVDPFETTQVSYYNDRILPNYAMDFYFNATTCDYKKGNLVRLQGGGPLDISPDTFTAFDNRRQNMSHYLDAIGSIEERIKEIQECSEKMQRALHQYSQQERQEGTHDIQEVLNLETLLFVSDSLMETKRRLHTELRRKIQDELDMINHILPEPLADSLTRILYPGIDC